MTSKEPKPKKVDNETTSKVSDKIGISRDKYIKVKKVWDTAKTGDTYAKSLVEKLDKKEVTVNEAANRVKVFTEAPEPINIIHCLFIYYIILLIIILEIYIKRYIKKTGFIFTVLDPAADRR